MCIFVSAKLQATAAPEAPAPMIRTSTGVVIANESLAMRGGQSMGSEEDCQRRAAMLLLSVVTSDLAYRRPAFFGMR